MLLKRNMTAPSLDEKGVPGIAKTDQDEEGPLE